MRIKRNISWNQKINKKCQNHGITNQLFQRKEIENFIYYERAHKSSRILIKFIENTFLLYSEFKLDFII